MGILLAGKLAGNVTESMSQQPAVRLAPSVNPLRGAVFATTANELSQLPASAGEVAFVGRSNAGKSSTINSLTERRQLAFVSKTPGRTQHINLFWVGARRYLVDLPGYGYASAPQSVKAHWQRLIGDYLRQRSELKALILIMDARHPLKDVDRRLLDWFAPRQKPVHVLLTKSDKLSRDARARTLERVLHEMALAPISPACTVQLLSNLTGEGRAEAIETVWRLLTEGGK